MTADRTGALSRRGFLSAAGLAGGGLALAACDRGSSAAGTSSADDTATDTVSAYGTHQAGITTAAQHSLAFGSFDVVSRSRDDVRDLLSTWSAALVQMTAGQQVGGDNDHPAAPPRDTGEAVGLSAGRLTVTVGFGPSLFDSRFGLASRRPAALADLPALPGDALDPARSNGDICVQACADDPQVAFHALRNLRRLAQGTATLRWTQLGFGKTSITSKEQDTPRNLMGFKDGTDNITSDQQRDLADHVWVGDETDQPWMRGGSYVVTRRIQMLLESWDRDRLEDQEAVFGRSKATGAPFAATHERDPVKIAALPPHSHVRLAHPDSNGGLRLLRRGYSFTDGVRPDTGQLDAGLFFIAFQKDPRTQFVPLQRKLGEQDALNEYIRHVSSAVFACPPGLRPGGSLGDGLFS